MASTLVLHSSTFHATTHCPSRVTTATFHQFLDTEKYANQARFFLLAHLSGLWNSTDANLPRRPQPSPAEGAEKNGVVLVRRVGCCEASTWPAVEKQIQKEISLSNVNVSVIDNTPTRETPLEAVLDSVLRASTGMDTAVDDADPR